MCSGLILLNENVYKTKSYKIHTNEVTVSEILLLAKLISIRFDILK